MPRTKTKSPKPKSPANKSKSGKSSPAGSSPSRITASTPKIKHVDLPEELKFSDIKISVTGFENMNPKHKVTEIIVQAEFMGVVIGESPQQPLSDDAFVDYHFNCVLRYFPDNPKSIQDLLGNPIIFNVFDTEGIYDIEPIEKPKRLTTESIMMQAILPKIKIAKVDSKKSFSPKMGKSPDRMARSSNYKMAESLRKKMQNSMGIVGRCSVDLMPLIMGESKIEDVYSLEQDVMALDEKIETWPNLPRIHFTIETSDPILPPTFPIDGNILEFSVDSIYNPSGPPLLNPTFYYTVGVYLPVAGEQHMRPILIPNGIMHQEPEENKKKVWESLVGLGNRAMYTKYEFDTSAKFTTKSSSPVDFNKIIANVDPPRIEWNILKRFLLSNDSQSTLAEKLRKYRVWPIEVFGSPMLYEREVTVMKGEDEIPIISPATPPHLPFISPEAIHLMGFIDITKLLFAGETKARVACQLETFNQVVFEEKSGFHEPIFQPHPPPVRPISASGRGKSPAGREKSPKSPKSPKKSKSKTEKKLSIVPAPVEEILNRETTKLYSDKSGNPTIIVFEVELLNPLFKKRTLEDLTAHLRALIPERVDPNRKLVEIELAEKDFQKCVEEVIEILYNEYRLYAEAKRENQIVITTGDDDQDFNTFLQKSGAFLTIKKMLKKKILYLVSERFPFTGNVDDIHDLDDYVNSMYVEIVKRINKVVNTYIGPDIKVKPNEQILSNGEFVRDLLYYAKEAEENLDYVQAERYYIELLDSDPKNPDYWLVYSIFHLTIGEVDLAFEKCKECLALDLTHKYGILLLGMLLLGQGKKKEGEMTLMALVAHHPSFLEGWVVLHLYYLMVNNFEGADVAYLKALKCLEEEGQVVHETSGNPLPIEFEKMPEPGWNIKFCNPDQIFARTASLLLKFHCFEYAQQALAQDLLCSPNTKCFSYYKAVGFYLQKKYNEALLALDDAIRIHGPDITVGGLMAHCFYRQNNMDEAFDLYESHCNTFDRPDDILIILTRYAEILTSRQEYEKAFKIMLLACKYCPTPKTWLQAGIIKYRIGDFENAEICFNEANMLDVRYHETWTYLGKLNKELGNLDVAELCVKYAEKYQLVDAHRARKKGPIQEDYFAFDCEL